MQLIPNMSVKNHKILFRNIVWQRSWHFYHICLEIYKLCCMIELWRELQKEGRNLVLICGTTAATMASCIHRVKVWRKVENMYRINANNNTFSNNARNSCCQLHTSSHHDRFILHLVTYYAGMVRVWISAKLCDPIVTHGPYLSALEIKGL